LKLNLALIRDWITNQISFEILLRYLAFFRQVILSLVGIS